MQFARFLLVGGIAALVNIVARLLLSLALPFELAVVLAYLCGMLTAFVLGRIFVFTEAGGTAHGQLLRFTLVNLVALAQVWLVSVMLVDWLFPLLGFTWQAELVGHTIGVLSPVFTSYLGHKHFSFRPAKS